MSGVALAQSGSPTVAQDPYQILLQKYVDEHRHPEPGDMGDFHRFWRDQFRAAISGNDEITPSRLRMLDELGAIERHLGEAVSSFKTYEQMRREAESIGEKRSLVLALDNAFELSGPHHSIADDEQAAEIREAYVAAAGDYAGESKSDDAYTRYANALVSVASALVKESGYDEEEAAREQDLSRAIELLSAAIDLGPGHGNNSLATRKYWLAGALGKMGRREEAAEVYDQIAAMEQDNLSGLWMKQLAAEQRYKRNSPEYANALEKILADHERDGGVDEYETTLRQRLGMAHYKTGEYEKANAVFTAATGKSASDGANAYNLFLSGRSLYLGGNAEAAKDVYLEVIRRYPDSGSAKAATVELARVEDDEKQADFESTLQPIDAGQGTGKATRIFVIINVIMFAGFALLLLYRKHSFRGQG